MNIDGIDSSQIEGIKPPFLESKPNETVQAPTAEEVKIETAKLEELAQQAQELPENRPDVVERGKQLFNDPNYPSGEVEDEVAKILLGVAEETY